MAETPMTAAERAWLLSRGAPLGLGRADPRCRLDMPEAERAALVGAHYAVTGSFGAPPEVPCSCAICEAGGNCVGMPDDVACNPEAFLEPFALHPADLSPMNRQLVLRLVRELLARFAGPSTPVDDEVSRLLSRSLAGVGLVN